MRALVAGATGFIGAELCERLLRDGVEVRALVRDVTRTRGLRVDELELHQGDVLDGRTLTGAGAGIDVAYYLVHSMGGGAGAGDFEQRELRAAEAFGRMCASEGVSRVIYLGGLGDEPGSKHLRSRAGTAHALERHGPPLTYFRAGMVVGPGSESYRTLRHLVARLPFMIAPRWLSTPTQPIDIDDVVAYLAAAPDIAASAGREVQIGSPDVLPLRCDARPHGDRARQASASQAAGAAADAVAVVVVDRARHAGRRRGRPAADRGPVDKDRRHRSQRRRAL